MGSGRTARALIRALALVLLLCALGPMPTARAADEKLIAFTFDDGPSNNTPVLLDGLEERGYVATFFMCGVNGSHGVVKHKDLLYRMSALGCQMADHSWSHPNFTRLTGEQIRGEVGGVEDILYDVAGAPYLDLVRIPGGSDTATIRANVPHPIIRWSVDPFDWRDRDADTVYERIMDLAHDGGIVLLHDLYITSIQGGLRAMDALHDQGYTFVTVSELFRRRGVYLENGTVYHSAPSDVATKPAYSAPRLEAVVDPTTGQTVMTMTSADLGVDSIRYTTDGSLPGLGSPVYTRPIPVSGTMTFTAAGFDRFGTRTPVASKEASDITAPPRIASEDGGKIALSCATPGARILYTTDGGDPRIRGAEYEGPFTAGKVTKAVAVVTGKARSDVVTITKTSDGSYFYDVPAEAWYYDAVGDMVRRGLMNGVGDHLFAPEEETTRAAIVSVLWRLEGEPASGSGSGTPYRDVTSDRWYTSAVAWATANGIINGKTSNTFDPDGVLTRQQAAAILYRYAQWSGRRGKEPGALPPYPDLSLVENYAEEALSWCESNGLLRPLSDGRLGPKDPALRGQCAAMVSALSKIAKH